MNLRSLLTSRSPGVARVCFFFPLIRFEDLYPNKKIGIEDIDSRIAKEISIDRDCWVVEIEDKNGFNPFHNLDG